MRLKRIRETILVLLTHKIALPMLKLVRRPNEFTYSEDDLQSLPAGTLGNDLFIFLKQRNLPLLKHYARHDLKHVLLGYDTTEKVKPVYRVLCLAMVAFHSLYWQQ
jgi:hypothetical protein